MSESLQNLSKVCNLTGLASVFIGAVVFFINFMTKDFVNASAGLYIFIIGYANVKISLKLRKA